MQDYHSHLLTDLLLLYKFLYRSSYVCQDDLRMKLIYNSIATYHWWILLLLCVWDWPWSDTILPAKLFLQGLIWRILQSQGLGSAKRSSPISVIWQRTNKDFLEHDLCDWMGKRGNEDTHLCFVFWGHDSGILESALDLKLEVNQLKCYKINVCMCSICANVIWHLGE